MLKRWLRVGIWTWLMGCSPSDGDVDDLYDTEPPDSVGDLVLEIAGAVLEISAEALRDPSVDLALNVGLDLPALPDGAFALTEAFVLSPPDTRFDVPVDLSMVSLEPGRGQLLRLDDDEQGWNSLDFLDVADSAHVRLLRFGTYVVVAAPDPADADGDGIGDDEDCDDGDFDVGEPGIATVWVKPGESVQEQIVASTSGDVIGVTAGVYEGVLNLLGKDLHLLSRCPHDAVLDGGGIGLPVLTYDLGAAGRLEGFVVRNGSATDGGGVFIGTGTPTLVGLRFRDNVASRDGGAVFIDDTEGVVRMEQCLFNDNVAGRHGGGLATGGDHQVEIQGGVFSNNEALAAGGGLYLGGRGERTLSGVVVQGCQAEEGGGLAGTGSVDLVDVDIRHNEAALRGGGAYLVEANISVLRGTFEGNEALALHGGGVAAEATTYLLEEVSFVDNRAEADGGAVDVLGGGGVMDRCTFQGNAAGSDGGALALHAAPAVEGFVDILACTFESNSAAARGGALFDATSPELGVVSLQSDVFETNGAGIAGGAVYAGGSALVMSGETFVGNTGVEMGGAIAGDDWIGSVSESEFTGNVSLGAGGALQLSGLSVAAVWGNSFDGNQASGVGAPGGAVRVELDAVATDEAGAPWQRIDHPQCDVEVHNTYGASSVNVPDDVAFAGAEGCPE